MLDELFNLIDTKKYFLTEEDCELILHIEVPMKVIKEIAFNLVKKEKDINGIINDLIEENKELKSKIEISFLILSIFSWDFSFNLIPLWYNLSPKFNILSLFEEDNGRFLIILFCDLFIFNNWLFSKTEFFLIWLFSFIVDFDNLFFELWVGNKYELQLWDLVNIFWLFTFDSFKELIFCLFDLL